MRPKSIEQFEKFFLGSLVLGLVNAVVSYSASMRMLEADPAVAAAGFGAGFYISTLAFGFAIPVLLWYFIARRASNVAKWILVAITLLGIASVIMTFPIMLEQGALSLGLSTISLALQLVAMWFLFRPDAAEWLSSGGRVGPVDPKTFE